MTKKLEWTIIILSLAGIADTAYLSYARWTNASLSCSFIEGCNAVAASPHSALFGILPLSYLGLAFYLAIFALGIALFTHRTSFLKALLLLFTFTGLASSAYFFYLQVMVIEAFCIYCLISAIISALLFFVSLLIYKEGTQ